MRGGSLICCVAPTGYRQLGEHGENVPVTPEAVAEAVEECRQYGTTIVSLHGRREDGRPSPSRLPSIASAVRELSDDVLVEYAVDPTTQLGDYLDVIDEGEPPEIAQVYLGPLQQGRREVASISHHDVARFVSALVDRGIKPNLVATSGRDLHSIARLHENDVLGTRPMVTLRFGPAEGTVASPMMLLALLESVPDDAVTFVSATGPNQFPLTTMAIFLGTHVRTGMADNLYLHSETPVSRNAQLVQRVADVVSHSQRWMMAPDDVAQQLGIPTESRDIENRQ